MIERWQIYAIPLGSISPGGARTLVPFQLDNDAPFVLRGRSIGVTETAIVNSSAYVDQLWTRFTDASEQWNASDVIPVGTSTDMPGAGGPGAPGVVYPQKPYQPGATIQVEVYNSGAADLVNAVSPTLYLHGVKLYSDGIYAPTYPARCTVKPFSYRFPRGSAGQPTVTINPSGAGSVVSNYYYQIAGDADYVFRGGMIGWSIIPGNEGGNIGWQNLLVTIKDRNQRAYSNTGYNLPIQGIPAAHILGLNGAQFSTTQPTIPIVGDYTPGLFVPEIYLKANDGLFFDFVRNDAGLGLHPTTIQICFFGSKVFPA